MKKTWDKARQYGQTVFSCIVSWPAICNHVIIYMHTYIYTYIHILILTYINIMPIYINVYFFKFFIKICSQLSERLEKQQTSAKEEMTRIKVIIIYIYVCYFIDCFVMLFKKNPHVKCVFDNFRNRWVLVSGVDRSSYRRTAMICRVIKFSPPILTPLLLLKKLLWNRSESLSWNWRRLN